MFKTDYSNTNGIVLPFPYGNNDQEYHKLSNFFVEYIKLIPTDISVHVICNSEHAKSRLQNQLVGEQINIYVIENFQEIWLRDIMGIKVGNKVILPLYKPDYYTQIYNNEYISLIRKQVKQIHRQLNFEVEELELVLDGGNFVSNGEVVIMTDKVIKDNPNIEIDRYFREKLNLIPLIIQQSESDKLGHSDGYLSFIKKNTIALSQYPKELVSLKNENDQLLKLKLQLIQLGFEVIDVFDRPVDEKTISHGDWLYSARGVFINNLILNDLVLLPEFNLPRMKNNIDFNKINQEIYKKLGFEVKTIQSDSLSKLGGGIHCVSWCF